MAEWRVNIWRALRQTNTQLWKQVLLKIVASPSNAVAHEPFSALFSVEAVTQRQPGVCWWTRLPSYRNFIVLSQFNLSQILPESYESLITRLPQTSTHLPVLLLSKWRPAPAKLAGLAWDSSHHVSSSHDCTVVIMHLLCGQHEQGS